MEAEQQAHVHDVNELNAQLEAEKRRLTDEKQQELESLRGSMEKATADRIAGLEAKHGEDLGEHGFILCVRYIIYIPIEEKKRSHRILF